MTTIVAEFGSKYREDSDQHSDNDLLILSNHFEKNLVSNFETRGYAVTFYNLNKFNYIKDEGNLFCKHLEMESRIILGSKYFLIDALSNFKPNPRYDEEIQNLKVFYKTLEFFMSKILFNKSTLLDINYVNIRNILIKKFATEGEYIFSYDKLISKLGNELKLNKKEMRLLRKLRIIKSKYRKGNFLFDQDVDILSNQIIQEFLRLNSKISLSFNNFNYISDYHLIRLVEMFDPLLSVKYNNFIKKPTSYMDLFRKSKDEYRIEIISAFKNRLNVNFNRK